MLEQQAKQVVDPSRQQSQAQDELRSALIPIRQAMGIRSEKLSDIVEGLVEKVGELPEEAVNVLTRTAQGKSASFTSEVREVEKRLADTREQLRVFDSVLYQIEALGRLSSWLQIGHGLAGTASEDLVDMPNAARLAEIILDQFSSESSTYRTGMCRAPFDELYRTSNDANERLVILSVVSGLNNIYHSLAFETPYAIAKTRHFDAAEKLQGDLIRIFSLPEGGERLVDLALRVTEYLTSPDDKNMANAVLPALTKWAGNGERFRLDDLTSNHEPFKKYCGVLSCLNANPVEREIAARTMFDKVIEIRSTQFDLTTGEYRGSPHSHSAWFTIGELIQSASYALAQLYGNLTEPTVNKLMDHIRGLQTEHVFSDHIGHTLVALAKFNELGPGKGDTEINKVIEDCARDFRRDYAYAAQMVGVERKRLSANT